MGMKCRFDKTQNKVNNISNNGTKLNSNNTPFNENNKKLPILVF